MPATSLDFLVREKASSTTLEALTGCTLGIEVDQYLRRMIQLSKSPLYTPWDGVSPVLHKRVREDLAALQKANIRAVFVFTGLAVPHLYDEPQEARAYARAQAFDDLEKRRNEETLAAFAALVRPTELAPALLDQLKEADVEFLIAPYFADAQLSSMLTTHATHSTNGPLLDCVYASADTLVYGIDRLIVDISFQQGRLSYCDRATILQQGLGGLTDDQFLDAFLFAGNDYCSLVPILVRHNPPELNSMRIRAAADVVRQNRTGFQALEGNPLLESDPTYIERWLRARVLFKNHPILTPEADVVLLNAKDAPIAAAEVVGPRLPREIYYYLSRGIVSREILNKLLSGKWQELSPLDSGETKEYRGLLDALGEYRVQCLDLLTASRAMHIYFSKRAVHPVLFHDRATFAHEIERLETPLREGLLWNVDGQFLSKYKIDDPTNIGSLLEVLKNPNARKESLLPTKKIKTLPEIQATVLYRFLQLRAYINPDHTLSDWGKALLEALGAAEPNAAVAICTSFELLKLRAIKFEPFSRVYPVAATNMGVEPEIDANADARNMARIAALLPLSQSDVPWQGALDRNMLVAFSIGKAMQQTLAHLYDTVLISLLLSGSVQRSDSTLQGLSAYRRPFHLTHDAGLAIFAKQFLGLAASGKPISNVNEMMRARFPSATAGQADVRGLLQLWKALFAGVTVAANVGCMGEVERSKFAALSAWCQEHLATV